MQKIMLMLLAFVSSIALASERPNVLIVMTDDQGLGDFSFHGNPALKTPHLDKLASESIRFTDFHSAPMCTPTRGQLMSGLDAVRNGATSVTGGRSFVRPGIPTLPQLLRDVGYRTGLFGKWHLGDHYPHRPMDRGFDRAIWHRGWGFTSAPEFSNTLFDGRYLDQDQEKRFSGHCTDFWFESAMQWMQDCQRTKSPFFCYLPLNAPHAPHVVADSYQEPYRNNGPAAFFGMIAQIDENIGKLDTFLKQTGLRENTLVIFLTDNGGTAGVKFYNAGLREGKTTFYEGGHRVPCWVRWPAGQLGNPRDIAEPTQMQDLLPTICELTSSSIKVEHRFDGQSLAALIRNDRPLEPRTLVVQYSRAKLTKWECCVIRGRWRLVHGKELYDVHADLGQKTDLAAKHPETVSELRDYYESWWKALEPLSSQFIRNSIGTEQGTVVELTSSDWQDVYCDNANHIREAAGGPNGGHWNLHCETTAEYRVTLRRWPKELDLSLQAGTPAAVSGNAKSVPGKALPIRYAALRINGSIVEKPIEADAKFCEFTVSISKGDCKIQGWFKDVNKEDLCGAFFVDVIRP